MANPRLLAMITAALLFGGLHGPAEAATRVQLQAIEQLILEEDWQQLYDFLQSNPELLSGTGAVVEQLRAFAQAYEDPSFLSALFQPPADLPDIETVQQQIESY